MEESKKYDFPEFISAYYDSSGEYSFHNPDPSWTRHWKENIPKSLTGELVHSGSCVKQSSTCSLCFLEETLRVYRLYITDEKEFRKEYEEFFGEKYEGK